MPQLKFQHAHAYNRPVDPGVVMVRSDPWYGRGLLAARLLAASVFISGSIVAGTYAAQLHKPSEAVSVQPVTNQSTTPAATAKTSTPAASTPPVSSPASATPQATAPDSSALQAVLDKWRSDTGSGQFGVVVQELGGQKRSASLQPDAVFGSASLYKLFLAQDIYSKIELGQFTSDDTLGMSSTVGACVQRMIVVSDNACGEGLAGALGWTSFNRFVQSAGFTNTVVSPTNTTTANNVAKFLEQLQAGTMMNATDSQTLLGYMKVQEYRAGIPAGASGLDVADKVGFITNVWNDAGIIYHPKGDYVVVVLSTNSGPNAIADLSQRINDFMNQ